MYVKFQSEHLQESDHLGDLGVDVSVDSSLPKYGVEAKTR
jgi:hypothetical protein